MTKTKLALITSAITTIIVLAITIPVCWKCFHCEKSDNEITPEKPGPLSPTTYTGDPEKSKQCGTQINLDGEMVKDQKNIFRVKGWDDCKSNYRDFPMSVNSNPGNMHGPLLGFGFLYNLYDKQIRYNIDLEYFYHWKHVSLGGGPTFVFDKNQLYEIGAKVAASLKVSSE